MYMFNPDDTNGSAEGASTQRETLVFRVQDRMNIAEVGWAETMSHAFEVMGETQRAEVGKIQTIWAPVQNLSLTEMYNAAVQARAAGTPINTIRREILRWSPQQMQQAAEDDMEDLILGRSAAQTADPTQSSLSRQQARTQPPRTVSDVQQTGVQR